jgi:hypothetical protein
LTSLRSAKGDKLLFALLVDMSGSNQHAAAEIKDAALSLFQALLAEGNEGHLVLFNTQIQMSEKTVQLAEVQTKLDSVQFHGGTALYDAIGDTCTKILSRSGNPGFPRRAIFLISDGRDNQSHIGPWDAKKIAEGQGVPIFFLATKLDLDAPTPAPGLGPGAFLDFIKSTGGLTFVPEKLVEGVAPLLNAVHHQWALTLAPTQPLDQKLHSLTIKTTQKDLQLSVPAKIFLP